MNLSELRGSMTQVELAKALHISRSSLIKYVQEIFYDE